MKLASLRRSAAGEIVRDGRLVVVSRDLSRYADATDVAPTLQHALDRWDVLEAALEARAREVDSASTDTFAFDPKHCASPLPRAYQWADGSAYVNHVALVRRARGAEMPERFWEDPLMYQGGSDGFLGPCEDIVMADESWGIDFEAEIGVVTDDVPMGIAEADALEHVKLLMLVNDVSLRSLIPGEVEKGFGFFQSKPASAFSPVAVTPDELGSAWRDGKVNLPLRTSLNGKPFGRPEAGVDMTFAFGRLIAHAARTRTLSAGTIIGSGTVSNLENGEPARLIEDGGVGYSCIAEARVVETLTRGAARMEFLKFGDEVRIEMLDRGGQSVFGAIEQRVARLTS